MRAVCMVHVWRGVEAGVGPVAGCLSGCTYVWCRGCLFMDAWVELVGSGYLGAFGCLPCASVCMVWVGGSSELRLFRGCGSQVWEL